MKSHAHTVSEEMYHRVYRLMKRDTDPRLIAAALNLPLRTVLNVIARLKKVEASDDRQAMFGHGSRKKSQPATFLDVYFLTKTRYAMVHLVGHLVKEEKSLLEQELKKVETSPWKTVAVRLTDVVALDAACARLLLDFAAAMTSHERYVAMLDPPAQIEEQFARFQIEGNVPIFGTERAFAEEAFRRKATAISRSHG